MPIVRAGSKLVYFVHVPKCGGTSIGTYLTKRFGPLAFLERKYNSVPEAERWTRSSPQHVPRAELDRLFPEGFFDATFATVRHPLDRLVSSYFFGLEIQRRIPPDMAFGTWLETAHAARAEDPYAYDNHIRPISDFIPQSEAVPVEIFRVEDGLNRVVGWLDRLVGTKEGPRHIHRLQRRSPGRVERTLGPFSVSPEERALVAELYAIDFERFGYHPHGPSVN